MKATQRKEFFSTRCVQKDDVNTLCFVKNLGLKPVYYKLSLMGIFDEFGNTLTNFRSTKKAIIKPIMKIFGGVKIFRHQFDDFY